MDFSGLVLVLKRGWPLLVIAAGFALYYFLGLDRYFGIEALRVSDHESGEYQFEVRRPAGETEREVAGELIVVSMPGTSDERIVRQQIRMPTDRANARFRLTAEGALQAVQPEA